MRHITSQSVVNTGSTSINLLISMPTACVDPALRNGAKGEFNSVGEISVYLCTNPIKVMMHGNDKSHGQYSSTVAINLQLQWCVIMVLCYLRTFSKHTVFPERIVLSRDVTWLAPRANKIACDSIIEQILKHDLEAWSITVGGGGGAYARMNINSTLLV